MIWADALHDKVTWHRISAKVQAMTAALHNTPAIHVAIGTQGKRKVTPTGHLHNCFIG